MLILKRQVLAKRLRSLLAALLLGAAAAYAVWPWLSFGSTVAPSTLIVYGFSILGEVMNQEIFPAFEREWKARSGQEVKVIGSFAASGTITNQLIMGVPGDVAVLSLELDALRLSAEGLVSRDSWRTLPHEGVLNRTPFIILVRPGNPHRVADFEDLARPGVGVVHPDPLTSGGANWALVAEYGSALRKDPGNPEKAHELLRGIWRNVVAQAASARAARTQFENGFGDALITYEQEALFDQARGKLKGEVIYPSSTVLSEHTVVKIERNIEAGEQQMVDAFLEFLWSEPAQRLFVKQGFRSVEERWNESNPAFGRIADPFLIKDFGGWLEAKRTIVDELWKGKVLKELGK